MLLFVFMLSFFFFNDTATTEIYTLSLHDALPIYAMLKANGWTDAYVRAIAWRASGEDMGVSARRNPVRLADRKSTRLNSSHANISYAVFCLKKKKTTYLTDFVFYISLTVH